MKNKNFNKFIEQSIKDNWEHLALSDYQGESYYYKDVARRIEEIHLVFQDYKIKKGDKIAICGRNSANWGVIFLAALSYGAVAVPILHEFKPDSVHYIVNHSDAKILFVSDSIFEELNQELMPNLEAVIIISSFSLQYSKRKDISISRQSLRARFEEKYSNNFKPEDVKYHQDEREELAIINYTSGTTGFSKGVMVPYRSLTSNVLFAKGALPSQGVGSKIVSMLPMAHMYGLMFEFIFQVSVGAQVFFLNRLPSPKIILEAFENTKPDLVITVPLIVEKIYKNKIQPILQKPSVSLMMKLPILNNLVKNKINKALTDAFGGNFYEIIVGGAALNNEAEEILKKIGFRYTVGYGMTECAPIVTYEDWKTAKLFSCGRITPRMEMKVDSPNPKEVEGEIMMKGDNVMLGYYKNIEATNQVLDKEGWLRTGDIGIVDEDGFLFIKGRSKNMILGPSGQNIYPEEIEDKINAAPHVGEALVVEEEGKLVALIYPDHNQPTTTALSKDELEKSFEKTRTELNKKLSKFCQISSVRIYPEEFEKTPKRSIKRYLYQSKKYDNK